MTTKKKIENTDELTIQETWDIVKFAESLGGYGIYGNALNPFLLNQRMQDVSMNPLQATESSLASAMRNPKNSELQLMGFSEDFENTSQIYKKLISYIGDMLSFDLTYSAINVVKSAEYKTTKYSQDLDVVKEFLDNFDYKKELRIAVRQMLRNEAFFCAPRFDTRKVVLQELPSSPTYTMITGRWEYGLLASLNMYWFLQPGVDINMYPKFFREKYNELWDGKGFGQYNSHLSPESRGGSSWVYWQNLDVNTAWVWKLSPELVTRLPYYTGMFPDLVLQSLMRSLQKNMNMSAAARLIIGQVGTLSREAGAKVKDAFNINPDLLGKFLSLVKSAIGDSMKVAAAPLDNIQGISFPSDNELYSSYLQNTLASSGVNTGLVFTSKVRPNIFESQASLQTDEQFVTALYPQFNAFLNYHINQRTKKYKFNFEFEGTHFFNNRQFRLDNAMTLANSGIVLPQKIAAAMGMSPFTFQRQLDEAKAMGFVDSLTPILQAAQMGNPANNGRPQKSTSELSDSGADTQGNGSNIEKGGKI